MAANHARDGDGGQRGYNSPSRWRLSLREAASGWERCLMSHTFAVVPVLIGPLQILLTILPGLIVAAISALISLLHPRAVLNGLKILWRQKLQVAVVAALGAGIVYGTGWLWRTFGPQPIAAAAVGGGDWPM